MASRSKAVRTHATIIFLLIGCLSIASKTYDHIACLNVGIIDHIATFHTASNRTIDNDCTSQVTDISSLTACTIDTNTHIAQLLHQFIVSIDDGADYLSRNKHLVTANGTAHQNIIYCTDTDKIINIHDQ